MNGEPTQGTRTTGIPPHLDGWQLPPGWQWGEGGYYANHRHAQEIVDALGRSLALVTAPAPAHSAWLFHEARHLAHHNHPAIPTTYHFWTPTETSRRGPGYLRRWIAGETVGARLRRLGTETVPYMLRVLRAVGSAVAYLHDAGQTHGALSPDTVYVTPTGRVWLLGWQWALPRDEMPGDVRPDPLLTPAPREWGALEWHPTPATDQWQLAASCFAILTGELPPREDIPPVRWVRSDCPANVGELIDRALAPNPERRFHSVASLLRTVEKISSSGTPGLGGVEIASGEYRAVSDEERLRWATGDDYEVLSSLGSGTFGSVWRVRDLTLQREVALKMLHQTVARSDAAVARFRREAQMAARLQHPAIVPIYDWDSKGDVHWYIMELEDEGSVADLVRRSGPRTLAEIAPQVDAVLDGLHAAHESGIIHRDLKPENMLIDRYRRWRIADFGIANAMGDEWAGSSGTPSFAPPEQLLGEPQGVAADLFAVAAIVYYALTGAAPFAGNDARAILALQLSGSLDLSKFPPVVAAWLRRGMAADPDQRFADAAEMRREWQSVSRQALSDDARAPIGGAVRRKIERFFDRMRRPVASLALIACAVASLGGQRPDSLRRDSTLNGRRADSSAVPRLEGIRVSVTRSPQGALRAPWAVGVQDKSELNRAQATLGFDEALPNIPGVYVANRYNYSLDQRLSIRGAGARANFGIRGVKVLLDGVPQSLPDGQNQLTNVDLADVSRVEVLRGSASSMYGNGSGGVIAITTDMSAPDRLETLLRVTSGSFGLTKVQSRTAGRAGAAAGSISLSRTTLNGFRQYSSADVRQLIGALDYDLTSSTMLSLRASHADMPTALNPGALTPAEYALNRDSAAAPNIARGANKSLLQSQYSLRMRHARGDGGEWAVVTYVVRRFLDNPLATSPAGTAAANVGTYSTLNRWVTGARLDASQPLCACGGEGRAPRLGGGFDIQRSFDVRRNWRATGGQRRTAADTLQLDQDESVISLGPFAVLQWSPMSPLSLSAGARWDKLRFEVRDHFRGDKVDHSGSRDMTAATGHLGATWLMSAALAPYVNYSTAFETPTTTELNARADGAGGFNPDLGPQRVRTLEGGARGTVGDRLSYTVSLFRSSADDAIVQYLETNGRAYFRNAGRTRNDGAEIGLASRLARWLDGNVAWTEARYRFVLYRVPNRAVTDTLDGKKVSGVPDRYVRLGLRAHWRATTFDLDHTWSSSLFADDKNTIRVEDWGRGALNMRAGWSGTAGDFRLAPFAAVNNVLNQAYVGSVTLNGALQRVLEPAPLRNYYLGMALAWRVAR
ncbi:MAG TPA: TonB-dependent receptor [Gemmatimonadaceae bacterium]|nr:TonB-dependent receptor [Gemmatimonadaceae bacterium]